MQRGHRDLVEFGTRISRTLIRFPETLIGDDVSSVRHPFLER
jgi:hypothetical protein